MEQIKKYGKWFVGGVMLVLALAVAIFSRKQKPEPESNANQYKGDRLEEQVQTAPITEQHKQVEEILKPVAPTVSKDMNSAINAWKAAGD